MAGALAAYEQVVSIRRDGEFAPADKQLAQAYYGIGVIAAGQQQYAEAVAALESAVRIDGTDADAWYQLGLAQLGAGVTDKAIAAERNAVAFVPLEWGEPYAAMAKAYTAAGQPELAAWAQAMTDLSRGGCRRRKPPSSRSSPGPRPPTPPPRWASSPRCRARGPLRSTGIAKPSR
ncbi:MAG: tetratricopeptide repeat protein [Chloroflexota bacterium]